MIKRHFKEGVAVGPWIPQWAQIWAFEVWALLTRTVRETLAHGF